MTVLKRTRETVIKIAILLLIVLLAVTYSSSLHAQSLGGSRHSDASAPRPTDVPDDANNETIAMALQNSINSPYQDIKPRLTPCGNRLYFSRNYHPGNANGVNDPEDIWYSDFDEATDTWSEPMHMNSLLNNAGPNFINNISASGDTIILGNQYLKKGKMRAGLSYTVNTNGEWSAPTAINIEGDYNMSIHGNAFVSLRDGVIIRSVQRGESIGERDLFVSFWDGVNATEPVNMGSVINTEFEESSPFLAADNKTLYFASKGHNGMGGFDIYVTTRLDDSWTNWTTPQNLGAAVNGNLDDEFFSITHCGKYAVFSRQVSVHNTDLYRISMDAVYGKKDPANKPVKDDNSSFAAL